MREIFELFILFNVMLNEKLLIYFNVVDCRSSYYYVVRIILNIYRNTMQYIFITKLNVLLYCIFFPIENSIPISVQILKM